MISIVGRKEAGKTTVLVALAAELTRRGVRVMTIKHGAHPADMDRPGKDTWRHWHEGRAERVLLEAPGQRVLLQRDPDPADPMSLARRYLDSADAVLVEGFTRAPLPKIEVFRRAAAERPIFAPGNLDADHWVAMLTDDPGFRAPFLVLRFTDTAWLPTLATLLWERATIVPPVA